MTEFSPDEVADYAELRARAGRALALEDAIYRQQVRFAVVVSEACAPPIDWAAAHGAMLAENVGLRLVQP